jgi:hypothetical protein
MSKNLMSSDSMTKMYHRDIFCIMELSDEYCPGDYDNEMTVVRRNEEGQVELTIEQFTGF